MLQAAAILKVMDFSFARVKGGGKEDEDTEFRAGKLKDLKICFKLLENTVAKAGEREMFLVFTDSKGAVIKTAQSGLFKHDNADKTYTIKTTVNYNRTTTNVCSIFKKPDTYDFSKGEHKVTVYAEGYEIGFGTVSVK